MNCCLLLCCILTLVSYSTCYTDLTREAGAHGTHVVIACVRLIRESPVFNPVNEEGFFVLLRKIALVETMDGGNAFTYAEKYGGGIWGVSKTSFEKVQMENLGTLSSSIFGYFGIDWSSVKWEDLDKPLYSALAAGMYLHLFNDSSTQLSLWNGLNGNTKADEDFLHAVVNDSHEIFVEVEEITVEDHVKRQLQTSALYFKADVTTLSDIEIEFSVLSGNAAIYVSNVFATSSAIFCGSSQAAGRLFLNANEMFPYTDGSLYVTVTGTTGTMFEVVVKSPVSAGDVNFASDSNEFIVGMFSNHPDVGPLPVKLLLTTMETEPVMVTIENITGTILNVTVSSTPTEVILPDEYVVSYVNETQKGLLVKASSGKKIGVSVGSSYVYSTDSYNALPVIEYAGIEEYTYYGITPYTNVTGLKSRLLLVGNHDHTTVTITVSQDATMINDVVLNANQSHVIELNRLETLLIESEMPLTGSKVVSSKPISFLSGHQCAVVPESGTSCDFAIEEFPPTITYGKQFMLQMLSSRTGGSHFTILTSEKDTNVSLWCGLASSNQTLEHSFLLDSPGSFKALEIAPDDVTCSLIATKPCVLAVFGTSENNDENDGDPLLIMIPPVEQFSTIASFKNNENLTNTYVNLVVLGSDYSTIKLDDTSLPAYEWKEIQAPSLGNDVFGLATRFEASDFLLHTIKAENDAANFNAILYGFDFSVGYGQRIGMMLKPIAGIDDISTIQPQLFESIQGKQLNCSTGGIPAHAFTWQKDGGNLITASSSKYSISSSGYTDSVLTINNPTSSDSGAYSCNIHSYYSSQEVQPLKKDITIIIEDLPEPNEPPSVTLNSMEYGNIENESVSIDASVSNVDPMNHVVSWRFTDINGIITDITNDTNPNKFIISENGHSLSVLNLQLGEQGNISVAVRSMGSTVFQEAPLQIYVEISLAPATGVNYTKNEGENVTLTCNADGIDAPYFIWRKDATLLVNSDKFIISHTSYDSGLRLIQGIMGINSALIITSLTEADTGKYFCVANNKALVSKSNSFTVKLIAAPDYCEPNQCVNGNCTSLKSSYRCDCDKGFEGTNCDTEIQTVVFIRPKITTSPSDIRVSLYDTGKLTCTADGHPKPQIKWYKDGNHIPNNNIDVSELSIESVDLDDRGIYHCVATNFDSNGDEYSDKSDSVVLNIDNVVQYAGMINITSLSSINQASIDSLFEMINQELSGTVIDGSTYFLVQETSTMNNIPPDSSRHSVDILVTILIDPSSQWNSSRLLSTVQASVAEISQTLQMSASLITNQNNRFDGCRANQTKIPSQTGNDNLTLVIEWPETAIGNISYVPCPCGDVSSDTTLVASRYCGGDFISGGEWRTPLVDSCDFSDLARELCKLSQLEVPERIEQLDKLTNTQQLNETEVAISVSILAQTADEVIGNRSLTEGFLNVADNILSLNESILQNSVSSSNSSARLRESLFSVADEIPIDGNASNTIIIRRTFAVSVQKVDFEDFTRLSYSINTNSSDQSEIEVVYEEQNNPTGAITLPSSLFNNKETVNTNQSVISNSVFLNDNAFQVRDPGFFVVAGLIISARVVGYGENAFTDLEEPVELTIQQNETLSSDRNAICVFFDTQADGGIGAWSTEGCFSNGSTTDGTIECYCNHLTSFSILLDLSTPREEDSPHSGDALTAISFIGLCVSITCLFITIFSYLCSRKLRKLELSQLLVNLCVALIGLYVTFIIAIYASTDTTFCSIISAALQYFFLVTFMSMAMEAVRLYIKLIIILKTVHGFVIKSVIISWVLPIFFVVFSIAPDYEKYVNNYFCRPSDTPYYVGMIAPFIVIYLFNWTIYIMTFVSLIKRSLDKMKAEDGDKSVNRLLRQQLITAVLLSTLLGIGWGIGLFVTDKTSASKVTREIVSALFVLLTAFHGLFVFIMHCLRSQDVRNQWKQWFFGITGRKIMETRTEESSMKKLYEKKPKKANEIHLTVNSSFTFTNSSSNDYDDSTLKFNITKNHKNDETNPANVLSQSDQEEKLPSIYEYEKMDEKTGHDAV